MPTSDLGETEASLEQHRALCEVLGLLTISWARLETFLDACVFILHLAWGGDQIENKIPVAFKRKVKFIRKCFSSIEALRQIEALVNEILDDVVAQSEERHRCVHGAIIFVEPDGRILFRRTHYRSDHLTLENEESHFHKIAEAEKATRALENTLRTLYEKLSEPLDRLEVDKV